MLLWVSLIFLINLRAAAEGIHFHTKLLYYCYCCSSMVLCVVVGAEQHSSCMKISCVPQNKQSQTGLERHDVHFFFMVQRPVKHKRPVTCAADPIMHLSVLCRDAGATREEGEGEELLQPRRRTHDCTDPPQPILTLLRRQEVTPEHTSALRHASSCIHLVMLLSKDTYK